MIDPEHQRAQELAIEAAEAQRAGDDRRARELFSEAAELERRAFERVAPDKMRTMGIIGTSLAALHLKAAQFDEADKVCRQLLAHPELLPNARAEIQAVLDAIPRPVRVGG